MTSPEIRNEKNPTSLLSVTFFVLKLMANSSRTGIYCDVTREVTCNMSNQCGIAFFCIDIIALVLPAAL